MNRPGLYIEAAHDRPMRISDAAPIESEAKTMIAACDLAPGKVSAAERGKAMGAHVTYRSDQAILITKQQDRFA